MKKYFLKDGTGQQGPFSVEELKEKNIKFVFVELPELPVYTDNVDPEKYREMHSAINIFVAKYHIKYFNYLHDSRFTINEFTNLPDHLNATGAEKISKIINLQVIIPEMQTYVAMNKDK